MKLSKIIAMIGVFSFFIALFFMFNFNDKIVFVSNNDFNKSSNISLVSIPYETEVIYSNDLLIGEERVVREGSDGFAISDSSIVVISPVNRVIERGRDILSVSYGSTTGYGADCIGCSGTVACSTRNGSHNLLSDGIYYNDSEYGNVRIIAADNSLFSCGTVMEIDNGIMDPFMAIVLDTGGAMRNAWSNGNILIDIAFSYENSIGINNATNRSGNVKFKVYRNGW